MLNEAFERSSPKNMSKLMVGNAPCSWGTLEFDEAKGGQIPFDRMLDELTETGYTGTELGDWGYMPTDPEVLRAELDKRGLVMLGAFVPVALKDPTAHEGGIANAVKTASDCWPPRPVRRRLISCWPTTMARTGKNQPAGRVTRKPN